MRKNRALRILKIVLFAVVAGSLLSFVVMHLWNWLMPALFGLRLINYWQALGVLLLSKILFGGFRRPGPAMYWRRRMMERWAQMTPEERDKFREGIRAGFGDFQSKAPEPKSL
jgi:hypothetical protein